LPKTSEQRPHVGDAKLDEIERHPPERGIAA
jgi:hypothetical protein